jgi:hypothetical protein
MIAVTAMVTCGLVTAQAADQTLTLTCEGTVKEDIKPKPISVSMGIIVNFSDRTVKGLGGRFDTVEITSVSETSVGFMTPITSDPAWTAIGSIDRVTGDLEATIRMF